MPQERGEDEGIKAAVIVWRRAWRGYVKAERFGANALNYSTAVGLLAASYGGARCGFNRQEIMITCTGAQRGSGGSGTTYGSVYVTPMDSGYLESSPIGRRIMAHEAKRSIQWAIGGLSFGPTYLADYWLQSQYDVFERMAGFKDGRYASC